MAALDDILKVDRLDGVFIGPADLAADTGFIGHAGAPQVKAAVLDAIERMVTAGKAAGILTLGTEMQMQSRDLGAMFIATDIDVTIFANAMRHAASDAAKRLSPVAQPALTDRPQISLKRSNCLHVGDFP